ncbi:T9SS type A sorting domain-containing protein [Adhaeribacter sp. BT258]|uniref:T9SS type A sorting domain-containing protein n=1 Tax=Adhaeribacter terrigena TaxID=2793070 RepID=A0ABS1C6D9_9BACT|nr:T9SS type A sorting domain-containing protein [Adhaeribacter terrigena]MBK0404939.1 T9SS type A sorting domain-containing protein [Adhaeribacter terrigena]
MNNFTNLCRKAALMLSLVLGGYASQAQTQIFFEKMGTVTGDTPIATHESINGFDNDALTMTVDGAVAANATELRKSNNKGTDGANDANVWMAASGDRYFAIGDIDASTYTNLTLEFAYRKEQAASLPVIELAYWNGTAYVPVTYTFAEAAAATVGWYTVSGIQLPAAAQINGLKLRWKKTAASVAARLDEVKLMGTAAVTTAPTIASTINGRTGVKTTVEESFSVATTAGSSANQLVKVKLALATPAQAADITLLYEATPGNFLPLTFNAAGEAEFGPAAGFPLANASTNFKITFAAAGTYNYSLAINDATTGVALTAPTTESVTVAAFVNPTIASTLNGRAGVVTGVQETYDVTTVAGDMAGRMVKVKATLATPAQAANMTLEYFETANSTWVPFTFDANGVFVYGPPATGFPLSNATSNFRVTYNAAGTYTTTLEIVDATTGVAVVPGVTETVTVTAPVVVVAPTIASTLNGRAGVVTGVQQTYDVTTTAGNMAGTMVKVKATLATPAQAANMALEYFETTNSTWVPFTFDANGVFIYGPPATGFPLANATSNFRVTYNAAGTYATTLEIIDATTGVALVPGVIESVTVTAPIVAPTIASTINGRTGVKTTVEENFSVATTTGSAAGQMVKVKMTLATPAQAADITLLYEATPGNFLPLTFNAAGETEFGPTTGFPLASTATNFKITFAAAGTYNYSLAINDATTGVALATPTAESVTVAAFVNPTIASTLNGRTGVLTGVQQTYDVTTVAGDMAGHMVKVKATLTTPAQAANMTQEYFETTTSTWMPLTFDANGVFMFGPATGFPLANATSNFRVTYNAAGTYVTTLEIVDAITGVAVVPGVTESVTVTAPVVAPTIASTLNARTNVKTTVEESFSVTTTTGTSAGQMVKGKMTLTNPAQAADVTLSYEVTPGTFLPLTFNATGEMEFGPATGFPLANLTSNFKVTFATAGTYDYSLAIIDAATGVALATPTVETVTVAAFVNPKIASDLNARTNLVTRAQNDFEVGITAGDMAGKTVNIKLSLTNPAQASDIELFYEDAVSGNYLPLTFDANGEVTFGPAAGFALADDTTAFRVIFNAPGTYDYTLSVLEVAAGDTLVAVNESVTILINGVKDAQLARLVNVYPNPATEVLNIELNNNLKAEVTVLDLTGKQVAALKNVSGEAQLNVAHLNAGTYLLQIKTAEGVATKRFVVVR